MKDDKLTAEEIQKKYPIKQHPNEAERCWCPGCGRVNLYKCEGCCNDCKRQKIIDSFDGVMRWETAEYSDEKILVVNNSEGDMKVATIPADALGHFHFDLEPPYSSGLVSEAIAKFICDAWNTKEKTNE
jgi:hypothetical protein